MESRLGLKGNRGGRYMLLMAVRTTQGARKGDGAVRLGAVATSKNTSCLSAERSKSSVSMIKESCFWQKVCVFYALDRIK